MSKFTRGDIVLTSGVTRRGQVITTWSQRISPKTGIPLVEVMMDPDNVIEYIEENDLELYSDEYEFVAVVVDHKDWGQKHLGEWGTFEDAEEDAADVLAEADNEKYKKTHSVQINRRRKAGHVQGIKAYRW